MQYETTIRLAATGECLREDTFLRFKAIVEYLALRLAQDEQRKFAKIMGRDVAVVSERLGFPLR